MQGIIWREILIRLLLAALFGGLIGLERERKNWAAGMRTHMLVCVGSALTMMVSAYGFADVIGKPNVVLDPSRIAAQVISGIGFIGAGTILFLRQGIIRGLTTAAGLWTVAAIGLATGGGMYFAAGLTTFIAIIILLLMQPLEKRLASRFGTIGLHIVMDSQTAVTQVTGILFAGETGVQSYTIEKNVDGIAIRCSLDHISSDKLASLTTALQAIPEVREVVWNK